jgi:Protein of unknown function (DUF3616)
MVGAGAAGERVVFHALRASTAALLVAAAAACGPADARPAAPTTGWKLGRTIVFTGACDASGAAGLGEGRIAVADDEDNRLRVYDLSAGGAPLETIETTSRMAGMRGGSPEMDLEAAATVGKRIYWIASHSLRKSGQREASRLRLLATDLVRQGDADSETLVGRPYESLLSDLIESPALARFDMAGAARRPPHTRGALNIEGLTDMPGTDHLLLGFRSPVPGGRALLIPIRNPAAMVERGERADLGPPIGLDLGRRGVRSLATWRGDYWIVAGSPHGWAESRLYRWDGAGPPSWVQSVRFARLNPEALAQVSAGPRSGLLVLSDDGERAMGARMCKDVEVESEKQFRGTWLDKVP